MPPPEGDAEQTTPALPDEMLEQIFLRLPRDEPACLVRASLISKLWLAILTGPGFRSRYREHHGAPRMLGFLDSSPWDSWEPEEGDPTVPPFVSTTGFCARVPDGGWGHRGYNAWDCRHGRVLLCAYNAALEDAGKLAVWDPMTGRRRQLQEPELLYGYGLYAAAVLCAVRGCHHLACHEGPFRVVFFSLQKDGGHDFVAQVRVSSPETCDGSKPRSDFQWSEPCPGVSVDSGGYIQHRAPVLVNNALHYMLAHDGFGSVHYVQILKYDMSSNCLSVIDAPNWGANMIGVSILMAMEDGTLGFAHLKKSTLFLWSARMGSDGVAAWTRPRVIDLKTLLPIGNPGEGIRLLGSVEGSDVVFVSTHLGINKLHLKSLRHEKISNEDDLVSLITYMGFYNPREKSETL